MSKSSHIHNYKFSLKQQDRLEPWQMPRKPKINMNKPTKDDKLFLQTVKDIVKAFKSMKRKLLMAEKNNISIRKEILIFNDEERRTCFQIDGKKCDIKYKYVKGKFMPYIEHTLMSKYEDGLSMESTYCSGIHAEAALRILSEIHGAFVTPAENISSINSFFDK